ncbi:shikimate kinase [Edaphocola flava]|uniref:shikimate kinase n=1 Tax=Edaphocola flava TaxID=2499629 RepID=UPI00100B1465|nr:shikimate kinase [Edaphocola flava]
MLIFLVGMPGVGKSYWMKKLSRQFGYEAVDMDRFIEQHTGKTIPELFAESEMTFRKAEQEALHLLTNRYAGLSCIISTGGGAPCYFDNMDWMLQHGAVVYLQGSAAFIQSRLAHSKVARPMFSNIAPDERLGFIETLVAQRSPFYEKATYTVDALSATIATFAGLFNSPHSN